MKAELIADWRLRITDRTLITLRVTDIGRILEERERLLAAAKRCVLPANQTQMADAIMYAEEDVS